MLVTCQNCQKPIDAPEKFYGRIVKCPYCTASVEIPSADEAPFLLPETSARSPGIIPPPLVQPTPPSLGASGRSRTSNNRQAVLILASICAYLLVAILYLFFSKPSRERVSSSSEARAIAELKNQLQSLKNQQATRERETAKRENEFRREISELKRNSNPRQQEPIILFEAGPDEVEEVDTDLKKPTVNAQDIPFARNARELVDERLELLARHPAPSVRVEAIEQLGSTREFADIVVPALLSAYKSDASNEVRSAVIVAFGELKNLGDQKDAVSAFLNNLALTSKQEKEVYRQPSHLSRLILIRHL